jgi:hypothetical protein
MKPVYRITCFFMSVTFIACSGGNPATDENSSLITTPVTVARPYKGSISKHINLSATSSYLKKNSVRSTASGYIIGMSANIGDYVNTGKSLYSLRTKEADALANFNKTNTDLGFTGEITIKAPSSGVISQVDKLTNDYVSDGDQLCMIADQSSLVFLLNVPFEQNKHAVIGTSCEIYLPDSVRLAGKIVSRLSSLDAASQTLSYIVRPQTTRHIPENLTAMVRLTVGTSNNTQIVDRSCVLADETMENFWVMKLLNDSIAVKVPVKTGIITNSRIEIISPVFSDNDRLINSGHYGLPDTAKVSIIKP